LKEYADWFFRQNLTAADGAAVADHLESGRRQLEALPGYKRNVEELVPEAPPFPEELGYLWSWFRQLLVGVQGNGMVPPQISWETLRAWQLCMGIGVLDPWEAETLVYLGALRASIQSEHLERQRKKPNRRG
jgi:hypothetical protein